MKYPFWKYPVHLLAYGLGSGKISKMPGTMGTLVAIPLFVYLSNLTPIYYISTVVLLYIVGVYICHQTAIDNHETDPGYIVFDEIVGFLVAMFMVPATWSWILVGFIIFRFFDILKPPPIKAMEKNRGIGMAIMLDDVIAGLYTVVIIHFILLPFF